mmetsp:Transcript_7175/g.10966  ORF Transcript_7175/g.10966 Transcript_7175/m.10966 type:complete len:396 (-) Transcript_7175:30-1217(-)
MASPRAAGAVALAVCVAVALVVVQLSDQNERVELAGPSAKVSVLPKTGEGSTQNVVVTVKQPGCAGDECKDTAKTLSAIERRTQRHAKMERSLKRKVASMSAWVTDLAKRFFLAPKAGQRGVPSRRDRQMTAIARCGKAPQKCDDEQVVGSIRAIREKVKELKAGRARAYKRMEKFDQLLKKLREKRRAERKTFREQHPDEGDKVQRIKAQVEAEQMKKRRAQIGAKEEDITKNKKLIVDLRKKLKLIRQKVAIRGYSSTSDDILSHRYKTTIRKARRNNRRAARQIEDYRRKQRSVRNVRFKLLLLRLSEDKEAKDAALKYTAKELDYDGKITAADDERENTLSNIRYFNAKIVALRTLRRKLIRFRSNHGAPKRARRRRSRGCGRYSRRRGRC